MKKTACQAHQVKPEKRMERPPALTLVTGSGRKAAPLRKRTADHLRTRSGKFQNYAWVPEEIEFVRLRRGQMTVSEIAEKLGRTYYAVEKMSERIRKGGRMHEIRLKGILGAAGIGGRAFARMAGIPAANMSDILNHGKFTDKDLGRDIKGRVRAILEKRGLEHGPEIWLPAGRPRKDRATLVDLEEDKWRGEMLDQSAMDFYGLTADPFDLSAVRSPSDIFWTEGHKLMKAALERAITRRDFIAVAGEVGTGKSLVRKTVIEALDGKHRVITPVILEKEGLSPFHLQEAIIEDLKAGQPDYDRPTRASKEARERQVLDLLKLYHEEGITCVLIIEEAHALGIKLLRTLKRLYEIQAGFEPLLGIVMIGQNELEKFWQDIRVREFNRRCRLLTLAPLRASEIPGYIKHKFARAHEEAGKVFEDGALKAVADRLKAGSPALQVNNLCARAVNRAAEARLKKITAEFVMSLD